MFDDNLLNSKSDSLERLWISTKIEKSIVAIGVVYFPMDNVAGLYEDASELQNELLQNITELQHSFANILLIGDFNGKTTDFRKTGKPSSNGVLLDNLIEASDMVLLNSRDKCTDTITWSRREHNSTIGYALCSVNMLDTVASMLVDEDHSYSLGSDHNFIIINANIKKMPTKAPSTINKTNSKMQKWNIAKDTDWLLYHNCIVQVFSDWHDDSANVDQ